MQCLLCKKNTLTEMLDLGNQPLANKYPKQEEFVTEDFYPLKVLFCTNCKNVQLGTIVSRERMFVDYYYLSSVNQGLVRHFNEMAKGLAGAKLVVDIGSNDGILLKPLKDMGVKAVGVEPSINVSKIANDNGLDTITAFFNAESAAQVEKEYGKADVLVCSSVFTHLEDPHTLIDDVKKLMTDDGRFIVEVEYIVNFIKQVQFERFYFDRIFYYSLSSLAQLFAVHGMYITDVEDMNIHGGSIRVVVQNSGYGTASEKVARLTNEEEQTLGPAALASFKNATAQQTAAFKAKLEEYKKQNLKVAGYGAPARVATITNYGQIGPELIEFIVDDSPLKQNRFSPGMHIPIVPNAYLAQHRPDVLVVFAYEYFDDIKKKLSGGYRFLIPIPPREVK